MSEPQRPYCAPSTLPWDMACVRVHVCYTTVRLALGQEEHLNPLCMVSLTGAQSYLISNNFVLLETVPCNEVEH